MRLDHLLSKELSLDKWSIDFKISPHLLFKIHFKSYLLKYCALLGPEGTNPLELIDR